MYTDFLADEPQFYPNQPMGATALEVPGMSGILPAHMNRAPGEPYDFAQYTSGVPSLTVQQFLRRPDLLYRRMTDIAEKGFIIDALLQGGYDASGGVVPYTRSESIYLDRDPEEIPEGGPYPVSGDTVPGVLQEIARKYGLKTFITEEMVRRNQFPQIELKMTKLTNTIIRYVDGIFLKRLVNDPDIGTRAAAAAWSPSSTTIVQDLENAKSDIRLQLENYEPDTLIIHPSKIPALTVNAEIRQAYVGTAALKNPIFTGQLPPLFGLNLLYTPNLLTAAGAPADFALLLQRNLIGGRADEVPLEVKALAFDEHYDRFWLKGRRVVATFLQEPKAIVKITGI